mgnify:CR=1 FL=1
MLIIVYLKTVPGVFQAVKIRNEQGQKDMYVDGGILCNYPVHVFDGKICKKINE